MTRVTTEEIFTPWTWEDISLCVRSSDIDILQNLQYGGETITMLFWGGYGLGKTSTARFLARCLVCRGPAAPLQEPCRDCEACAQTWTSRRMADNGVSEVDCVRGSVGDVMDRIESDLFYRPCFRSSEFVRQVLILDEVHRTKGVLSDRLLKITEEANRNLFLLCAAHPEDLGAALVQRCVPIRVQLPKEDQCKAWLSRLLRRHGVSFESSLLAEVLNDAGPNPRDIKMQVRQRLRFDAEERPFLAARSGMGVAR